MAHSSVKASRSGRVTTLAIGVLLTSSLLASAQTPLTSDDGEVLRKVNESLAKGWKENKLTPSARCSDYEFIRRASLDIIGRIAKPEEIQRFLKDPPDSRRRLLIERLLQHEEYSENWANVWTVLFLTRAGALDANRSVYHEQMRVWLQEQFAKPTLSWKELATELLTATGKTNANGAVNFILSHLGEPIPQDKRQEEGYFEMVPVTSRTTRLFLGLQTQCTQCHDHPFNPEWKQHHFWGVNAFFRQVQRVGSPAMRRQDSASVLELKDDPSLNREGIIYYEKRNGVVLPTKPVFLDGTKLDSTSTSRRQALALYLTRHENFTRAFVNRMWAHFMGRGFTNPVDDFGEHNPPSNPEALEFLGKKFEQYGYEPKRVIRWICNTDAYSLSSVANKTNDKQDAEPFFSRMLLKAMSPEQMFDSLMVATKLEKAESRQRKEAWMRSLTVNFGDDEGNEATFNGTVVQALLMMNGKDINDAISYKDKGTVAQAYVRSKGNPSMLLNELYLAALNRPPTTREAPEILRIIRTAPVKVKTDPLAPWQDVFWALLNSNEFILNH